MEIIYQPSLEQNLKIGTERMEAKGELELIDWIRQQKSHTTSELLIGPGDDCAMIRSWTKPEWLITTDMLMEGSCFLLDEAGPYLVGRKALAVNLSDIAAMGGIPKFAVISVGLPRSMSFEQVQELHRGIQDLANEFQVAIIGGDTNSWTGGLTISITLLGQPYHAEPIRRNGAKPGDVLFVSGSLGGSILGKHLHFQPRIQLAQQLQDVASIHAMMDLSDGLSLDLHRLCKESGCGAMIQADALPLSPECLQQAHGDKKKAISHALNDGEDFELLFSVNATDAIKLENVHQIGGVPIHRIGQVTFSEMLLIQDREALPLLAQGYQHAFGNPPN